MRLDSTSTELSNSVIADAHSGAFAARHLGPNAKERQEMLRELSVDTLSELIHSTVPREILDERALDLPRAATEQEALEELQAIASQNKLWRCFLGLGYSNCIVPSVIRRNVLENPGWYTQYTPYQAEIAQGRLEALLNFQTLVCDLTGLAISNASLLDEGTAAAEAMQMAFSSRKQSSANRFFVSENLHPQTIAVLETRANPLGQQLVIGKESSFRPDETYFGAILQYPGTFGEVPDAKEWIAAAKSAGLITVMAADPLALVLLKSPGELGADIAVGSMGRFGVPMGFGGPHAAYIAAKEDFSRKMPGRMVGVSKDSAGNPAIRLALQTREQHIRRDKATSNICTAQVLLAVMSSMYAVYHGAEGLRAIASRVHGLASSFSLGLAALGLRKKGAEFFDTVSFEMPADKATRLRALLNEAKFLVRSSGNIFSAAFDEQSTSEDIRTLLRCVAEAAGMSAIAAPNPQGLPNTLCRTTPILTHPVFSSHRTEHQMLRYIRRLEGRDLSLTHSMIPLGSCTMKLNAAAELFPISWPEWSGLHPFVPREHALGYMKIFSDLEKWLSTITGFDAVSLQPNSGAQGEYAGLLVIREYHRHRGDMHRNVCLIPKSAHGTNPASAVMAGMKVVVVDCDDDGNIDPADLRAKVSEHAKNLAALMMTYPSTHGVFEEGVHEICRLTHGAGGQVYMDGANMNAQVGLCRPASIGADVCHLNLHKTFCIPHGGGGPGMGPIGVKSHLAPYLPSHPLADVNAASPLGPVSAAPWGSAGILPISWMYIRMMGAAGLKMATEVAILNANYVAHRLSSHYPVVYRGKNGRVAHECIVDLRAFKRDAGVEVEDVAKRLMDYGFHAPTVSWPVAGTMMIEPTESESKDELDRFCDAMISIAEEVKKVRDGSWSREDNPLKHAPHTSRVVTATEWKHSYSREIAAYPGKTELHAKFWPSVGRIDNVWGDRNLFCTCPPIA